MDTPKYQDYEGLIMRHALSFNASTGLSVDELMAEGRLYFTKALSKWDPSRGKFSTLLVWYLRSEMINWAKGEAKRRAEIPTDPDLLEVAGGDMTVRSILFREELQLLGHDAQIVARIVYTTPTEIVNAVRRYGDGSILTHITRWLKKQGWKEPRILAAYDELRELANSL